ncbi:reverse transcriptase domain-containing protein [Tanacetum coccineum]
MTSSSEFRRRVSSSSEDSSDNEDAETGPWKSKNKYREDEDEDMSRPWRRQKVDAFTRRISDFSEAKKRRMPANVRRAFRLNFTQRKKCAKNPVELARVKQRQGESTSAYVERYKDECIHVKACPKILKISGFMNGINNPELIKRLNDRVPQTFDELMKRTRSFIQGEAAAADSRKGYSNNRSQEQSRRQSNDQSSSRNNSYRGQRGGRGNDKYTPLTMTPKEILATEGANFPRPPPGTLQKRQRVGNGYEGRLDHLVKNIKEGKDKQRSGGKKDAPRDKADTIYMVQSWQRKTKQKVSQKFSHGSGISFPTLTADNAVVEPLTIEINAAGHDIHRMYIDGGASADILYEHCFQRLRPEISYHTMALLEARNISRYAVWSHQAHGMLKFPVDGGIVTIYNTAAPPKECNTVTCDVTQTQRQHATKVTNLKVAIHPDYPEQEVSIGGSLSDTGRAAVCALLQRNLDIFAWEPKHMTGVPRSITEHKLKIRQGYSPVRQKKRGQAPERAKAILEELWSKRAIGSWGCDVDFTDLNKLVHKTAIHYGDCMKSGSPYADTPSVLLGAYKGFTKTKWPRMRGKRLPLPTCQGVYCYTKMPFGLKNAGATYQRLVDNAFEGQVGRNLEVYVDDLVIKSHTEDELVRRHSRNLLGHCEKIQLKLNLKCTFGATRSMFLGYLIEPSASKPCPENKKAVAYFLQRHDEDVQTLNGKFAGLDRPRTAVKGQILADFLIKKPETDAVLPQSEVKLQEPWILFTDGSSCVDGTSNNEAEYECPNCGTIALQLEWVIRNLEAICGLPFRATHYG